MRNFVITALSLLVLTGGIIVGFGIHMVEREYREQGVILIVIGVLFVVAFARDIAKHWND